MGKKDSGHRLREYLHFATARPELFVNPPQGGYAIILDERDIGSVETLVAEKLEQQGLPKKWAEVGIVYEDQYMLILRDAVRYPDGHLGTYIRMVSRSGTPSGVAILPVYHSKLVLLRHFRHASRAWHLEIPRGFGEKNMSSAENARRELAEETGGIASTIVPLGPMDNDTGMGQGATELFYADMISIGQPESCEAISRILKLELTEVERLIREAEINDSFTIAAYARAKLRGLI